MLHTIFVIAPLHVYFTDVTGTQIYVPRISKQTKELGVSILNIDKISKYFIGILFMSRAKDLFFFF